MAFKELYKIRPIFEKNENLRFRFALIDMEEYRLLNGWSRDKKKGSERYDRIPVQFVEEVCIERREDYMQFIPFDLPEPFTTKEFFKICKNSVVACTDCASNSDGFRNRGQSGKTGE